MPGLANQPCGNDISAGRLLGGLPAWKTEVRSGNCAKLEPVCSTEGIQTKRRN